MVEYFHLPPYYVLSMLMILATLFKSILSMWVFEIRNIPQPGAEIVYVVVRTFSEFFILRRSTP